MNDHAIRHRRRIRWRRDARSAALAFLATLTVAAGPAHAQSEDWASFGQSFKGFLDRYFWGKNVASVGFFYVKTLDSSEPLKTTTSSFDLGTFTSPGTSSTVNDAVTPTFTFRHFFTENFATTFVGAIPPTFTVDSKGFIAPFVPGLGTLDLVDLGLSVNNPAIRAREWAPAFLIHYFFGAETNRIRPFLGVGVTYNFFTDVKLNNNLENTLANLGPLLQAGQGVAPTGKAKIDVDLSSSWQVVGNAGVQWEFIKDFMATVSVSYVPLSTTATITFKDNRGNTLATSKADIKLNPLVFEFALGYKF